MFRRGALIVFITWHKNNLIIKKLAECKNSIELIRSNITEYQRRKDASEMYKNSS